MKKEYLILIGSLLLAGFVFFKMKKNNKNNTMNNEKGRQLTKEEESEITSSADESRNYNYDSKFNKLILNNYNKSGKNVGQRGNNPLNIRANRDKWQGEKGLQIAGTNGKFVVFENLKYGTRAAFRLIKNYIKSGNNTINKIITKWAPSSDGNNTTNYINRVAKNTQIPKEKIIETNDFETLKKIVAEMAIIETGIILKQDELKYGFENS